MEKLQNSVDLVKNNISTQMTVLSSIIQTAISVLTTLSAILWVSIFLYITFYVYYVPVVEQEKPVYFQFRYILHGRTLKLSYFVVKLQNKELEVVYIQTYISITNFTHIHSV